MSYNEPPSYGTPPPPPGGAAPAEHPRATLILVLGILSIIPCGFITGIPAIIMGKKGLDESKTVNYTNAGLLKAGFICGIIGTALSVCSIIANLALLSG